MNRQAVQGKVLALTRNIFLRKPSGQKSFKSSFLIKSEGRYGPFGTEWWTTFTTHLVCADLAQALIITEPKLSQGDEQSFQNLVLEVIRDSLLDSQLFDFAKIFPPNEDTLFGAIAGKNKADFAERMLIRFAAACEGAIRDWLVIYPLQRIHSHSVSLGFNGIALVAANDLATWKAFAGRFEDTGMFDIQTATWFMDSRSAPLLPQRPTTWLLCETRGTVLGARLSAARYMRTFVAVAFSVGKDKHPNLFTKSGLAPCTYSVQFAGSRGNPPSNSLAAIGSILPPLLEDWEIEEGLIKQVKDWHQKCANASPTEAHRAITASQFLHYSIIADDIERFIHLFITLDALFGERGKVEAKILEGVSRIFAAHPDWEERTRLLFDLRSEVVHGECSNIAEWKELEKYTRRFRSNVFSDAASLAVTSLTQYFNFPPQAAAKRFHHVLTKPVARALFRAAGWLNQK